jgi:hypothetical protein
VPRFRVDTVPRKRSLPEPANESTLPTMVGAVIYVRVSTKEQTENLSLPTQLRACEEYCRRQGYEVLERFHEGARAPRPRTAASSKTCSRTAASTRATSTSSSCSI